MPRLNAHYTGVETRTDDALAQRNELIDQVAVENE